MSTDEPPPLTDEPEYQPQSTGATVVGLAAIGYAILGFAVFAFFILGTSEGKWRELGFESLARLKRERPELLTGMFLLLTVPTFGSALLAGGAMLARNPWVKSLAWVAAVLNIGVGLYTLGAGPYLFVPALGISIALVVAAHAEPTRRRAY